MITSTAHVVSYGADTALPIAHIPYYRDISVCIAILNLYHPIVHSRYSALRLIPDVCSPLSVGARTDSSGRASASRPRSAAHRVVVLTARPATVADSRDSNLESCCGPDNERLSSRPWRFFCSKTAHSFGLGPLQTIKAIIIPCHEPVAVAWLSFRDALATRWTHRRSFPVAGEPLHCTARVGCTIRCTSCMFTGHTCYLPAPGAAGFSPSRNLAAGGGSRRLAGARAGVRPPARSRPFLALAAVVSRHACAVSHIPCTPTLPLVVRPSLLNPPCGLQVAVVVVVSPTRCPARGGMSAMGGRGKLCAAAVAGMTSCRALLLRSRCLEEDT